MFPEADIFTLFHVPGKTTTAIDKRVRRVSWLNRVPGSRRFYRLLLPFYPHAARSFCFNDYDLVISLSHAAAKNVSVPVGVPHFIYCFTPMRYIWDQARAYFGWCTPLLWPVLYALRQWDRHGGHHARGVVAISRFIAARIRMCYGIKSLVIAPPVATHWITPSDGSVGEAYLWAGALVPYKRPDLVVRACTELGRRLWVVGDGPERSRLEALAGDSVTFLGRVSDQELAEYYRRCRALIFPGVEDFGMIPVECMAAGRPIIGLDKGGLRDSLKGIRYWNYDEKSEAIAVSEYSGVFIRHTRQRALEEVKKAIEFFESVERVFSPSQIAGQAERFSKERFIRQWRELLNTRGIEQISRDESRV
jgi:glycosyltransferase involved in cell wall biosynthesis